MEKVDLRIKKRPGIAFIKLVEATGILLGIPKQIEKSLYKAPAPSNYDKTIEFLSQDFYGVLVHMAYLKSADITNEVSVEMYLKIQEPGFDYEAAIIDGGLCMRELFDAVYCIISNLQEDKFRVPVRSANCIVLVDGSRSSYTALDAAQHVSNIGILTTAALIIDDDERLNDDDYMRVHAENLPSLQLLQTHLQSDLFRRCKMQYKLADHRFQCTTLVAESTKDVIPLTNELISTTNCKKLVLGMENCNLGLDSKATINLWAAWKCNLPVVFAKGRSKVRPFSMINQQKVFQVCVKNLEYLDFMMENAVEFIRPGDFILFVTVLESRESKGDWRESRYDNGIRSGWNTGPICEQKSFILGWNDHEIDILRNEMQSRLDRAQIPGMIRIEREKNNYTTSQILVDVAIQEQSDMIIVGYKGRKDVIIEIAQDAPCSIVIVKDSNIFQ